MKHVLMAALATAALGMAASPASAAATLQQCNSGASCVSGTTNVNLVDQGAPGSLLITGTVSSGGPVVNFTSTNGLLLANNGAATIFRPNNAILTQLTFTLLTGSFTAAEFDLLQGSLVDSESPLMITLTALGGGTSTFAVNKPTGGNVFDIIAGTGESYTSASFSTTNGGFNTFKQLRLVLAAPRGVPEPATWAMMLLGFGGIGLTMRRRRRNTSLMQIA